MYGRPGVYRVGQRVETSMGLYRAGQVIAAFCGPFTDGQYRQPQSNERPVYVQWDDGTKGWIHREFIRLQRAKG